MVFALMKPTYMIQQKDDSKTTYQFDEKQLMQTTGKKMYAPVNGGFGVAVTYRNVSLDLAFPSLLIPLNIGIVHCSASFSL